MSCPTQRLSSPTPVRRFDAAFHADIFGGLSGEPKRLPCKYFYDDRGSALFDAICNLDEYYLTRTELEIMKQHSAAMARAIGAGATLVEFGSGSGCKTPLLLDQLEDLGEYIPVDISRLQLLATARRLAKHYPQIDVRPVCEDFTKKLSLPTRHGNPTRRIVYFPGSTIGNFEPADASALIVRIAELCDNRGGLLIGIDLQKDAAAIEAAYNDILGITAQFNLNLLRRINRELDGNFDLEQFEHSAFYDEVNNRVDIRLTSRLRQSVNIGAKTFAFRRGEDIRTEYSYKYTVPQFEQLARPAGFRLEKCWLDDRRYFAVLFFNMG
jgi:dimethylhistidine N-methyltransferase